MKKIITGTLATLFGIACSFSASAEPLNYDYVYLSNHDIEKDDSGKSDSSDVLGAFWEFTDTLHATVSYDSAGAYASSFASPAEVNTYRFGVGGHYLLNDNLMIAPAVYAVRGEAQLRDRSGTPPPGWDSNFELADTGYAVGLDLRYMLNPQFELTAGAKRTSLFDNDNSEAVGGVLYHPTDWLALGALYHDREDSTSTELTVRWYF